MENTTFKRLKAKLKRRETSSAATASATPLVNQTSLLDGYNDRQRVQNKYEAAVNELKEAINVRKGVWGSFDCDELSDEPERFDDAQFKNKINAVLISRETSIKDRKGWSKFTSTVECVFTAFSPFAKNVLTVAKNAQSVVLFNLELSVP